MTIKLTPMQNELAQMFDEMKFAKKEVRPSKYWKYLNQHNMEQLEMNGYKNFKQTICLNYFTFIPMPFDKTLSKLKSNVPFAKKMKVWSRILKKHDLFLLRHSFWYNFSTGLLWEYAKLHHKRICDMLEEPSEGNPPKFYDDGKLISEDLAHAVIEYAAITDKMKSKPKVVIELGGGYGRDAYVFLKLHPEIRYIMVDIPPALWIAQKYLSTVFPYRKVFKFRHFENYKQIEAEFKASSIAFITPNQLEMLPDKSANLSINISSLHEMRMDQIAYFFKQIDRITNGFFYFKEWKISYDPFIIKEHDYPILDKWLLIYHRDCIFPSNFFEVLYRC